MPISLSGSLNLSGSLTTTGTITATTLVVQTITSSISSITGSTNFGSLSSNTHTFTGSLNVTGALYVATGSVGIGITNPYTSLAIKNGNFGIYQISGSGTSSLGGQIYLGDLNFDSSGYFNSAPGIGSVWSTANAVCGDLAFYVYNSGANTRYERMRILSSGNVGIGTSSPGAKLDIQGSSIYMNISDTSDSRYINFGNWVASRSQIEVGGGDFFIKTQSSNYLAFGTNATERMRITSGGYTKISNSGAYEYVSAAVHEIRQTAADYILYATNPNASPNGHYVSYTTASPNGTGNPFLVCSDSTATRFTMRSNGGLANYQSNDANLSDERVKKDIISLESYWNKFKALEIVKYKYKDQTHDDFNIGVIAQQVESVAPEFVDVDGFGETPEDGIPLKTIYTADLYHATIKVLQEAMAKIETLEARVQYLENK